MVGYLLVFGVSRLREQLKFILDVSELDGLSDLIKQYEALRNFLHRDVGFNEVVHVLVLPHILVALELDILYSLKNCMQK